MELISHISLAEPKMKTNLSFTQKIARLFEKHKLLMNIPFIKNFTNKQLNVLPPAGDSEGNNVLSFNGQRNNFIKRLSNNGKYRNSEPIKSGKQPNQQNSEKANRRFEENEK